MELGFGEIVVVLFIVVLLFGPKKLPQLGDGLGRAIRNFKDAANGRAPAEAPAPARLPAASATAAETERDPT